MWIIIEGDFLCLAEAVMREYTIHPLAVGINETDQGVMTYLREYGKRIYLPIYAFYIKGGDSRILVDTGLADFVTPPEAEEMCGFRILEFEEALATVGLTPEEARAFRSFSLQAPPWAVNPLR
jgi:hypothetical protein